MYKRQARGDCGVRTRLAERACLVAFLVIIATASAVGLGAACRFCAEARAAARELRAAQARAGASPLGTLRELLAHKELLEDLQHADAQAVAAAKARAAPPSAAVLVARAAAERGPVPLRAPSAEPRDAMRTAARPPMPRLRATPATVGTDASERAWARRMMPPGVRELPWLPPSLQPQPTDGGGKEAGAATNAGTAQGAADAPSWVPAAPAGGAPSGAGNAGSVREDAWLSLIHI